jgi:hypothetical protein
VTALPRERELRPQKVRPDVPGWRRLGRQHRRDHPSPESQLPLIKHAGNHDVPLLAKVSKRRPVDPSHASHFNSGGVGDATGFGAGS